MDGGLNSESKLSRDELQRRLSDIGTNVNSALKFIVTTYIRGAAKLSAYSLES